MGEIKNMNADEFTPTAEQTLALDHEGSDLLISAGAGSGKTSTLTDRIVKRIYEKKMDISRILVVTYTKDAANDLKSKITKKLANKLAQMSKDDEKRDHVCAQLVKVSSADISTIHSFCLKSIRPYFDKLNITSDFRIGEDNELFVLKQEAMNEVIDAFYEEDSLDPDFLLVSDCYSKYTEEEELGTSLLALHNNLISTYKGLDILLAPPKENEEFLSTEYGKVPLKKLQIAVKRFRPLISEIYRDVLSDEGNKKYENAFCELNDILQRLENALITPKYQTIKGILEDYKAKGFLGGKYKKKPTVDIDYITYIRDDIQAELLELKDGFFYADESTIRSSVRQNAKICKAIHKVLTAFDNAYKEKKRKYGLCDFNDLERYTAQLFYLPNGDISPIAKEISLRYDELYIDEYQDVNSLQDKIFYAIARNNRFMVGDIKQSIYSFRSAEPKLFSDYRDSFKEYFSPDVKADEGKCLFMSDNFRCDPSIISLTNHISDYMFLNSKGFNYVTGDRLKPSKKHKGKFTPQNASLIVINKSELKKDSPIKESGLDPQAELVAQEIRSLLDSGTLPNGDKIEPKHIAILLRATKGAIDKYIDALNRYGIKNEYIQEISFFEKAHVLLMLCLLNAIDNPAKDVYLVGALHSPIWNFSLEELVKIKRFSPKEYSLYSAFQNYGGDKEIRDKIDTVLNEIDRYRLSIRKMSADEAISYIMTETGYLSACNETERQDIIKLYNMARSYEQGSYKGLYSFLRYIEDSASKGAISETVTSDPNNSVKIVTMHKSKGLEYEICFLCDTEKAFSRKSYTEPILFHKELGICGYVSRDGGIVKYDNILRKCASLAIKNAQKEEALRLLYVAMTRAKSKLYIVANMSRLSAITDKYKKLEHLKDEYSIYSKNSHIEYILDACTTPLDFLDIVYKDPNEIIPIEKQEETAAEIDENVADEYTRLLKERFSFEYKYEHLNKLPSKLSISTLYPEILDDEDNAEFAAKKHTIDSIPRFLDKTKSKATGSERGTATHAFLQFCSFENLQKYGAEYELKRLVDSTFISKTVGDIIHMDHIEKFISSEIFKEFLSAKQIIREVRFNVMLDAKNFSKDNSFKNEKVLVQGITDCIYENDRGEMILVDYKTDSVTEDNYISYLKEKHSTQLTYYKKACEMMFERPIAKVLIYSVPLAKTVEIK